VGAADRPLRPLARRDRYPGAGDGDLDAGNFSDWMAAIRGAIDEGRDAEVPCAGCTACCTSGQFVDIGPDEVDTLARIPPALLARAPRRPPGHVVLGHDERGHCPMLVDGRCSIYERRPRACRTYDCRVFAATGIEVDAGKTELGRQARRWRFGLPTPADRARYDAARAAGAFLSGEADLTVVNATDRALLALDVQHLFLRRDEEAGHGAVAPDPDAVRAEISRRRRRPQ
jgi:Fe-S-cluster containining protein